MAAARPACEKGVGKGDRQAQVALPDDFDTLGRVVQHVVAVVADADHDAPYGGHRRYHVTFRGGRPGDEILRLVHVETVAFDARLGAERERVVVVVGRGVHLDDEAFDEARQVFREPEGDAVFAAGLHAFESGLPDDDAAVGVRALEAGRERGRTLGHGEVARAVGRVVQRRDAALLNLPFVERVGGDYPRMEILAESGGNRGVEFHFGDDVLPFALHFGYGRLSGCHRKGLLAFVETFGERRGDGFSRIDLHAVFAREQLQP